MACDKQWSEFQRVVESGARLCVYKYLVVPRRLQSQIHAVSRELYQPTITHVGTWSNSCSEIRWRTDLAVSNTYVSYVAVPKSVWYVLRQKISVTKTFFTVALNFINACHCYNKRLMESTDLAHAVCSKLQFASMRKHEYRSLQVVRACLRKLRGQYIYNCFRFLLKWLHC